MVHYFNIAILLLDVSLLLFLWLSLFNLYNSKNCCFLSLCFIFRIVLVRLWLLFYSVELILKKTAKRIKSDNFGLQQSNREKFNSTKITLYLGAPIICWLSALTHNNAYSQTNIHAIKKGGSYPHRPRNKVLK